MPQFARKPTSVVADQWFKNGDHPEDYAKPVIGYEGSYPITYSPQHQRVNDWSGQVVKRYRHPKVGGSLTCSECGHIYHEHGWIDSPRNVDGLMVCPGDWVITGPKGEYYPCKPDIFEATHEPTPGE